jgi:hypothetical protein
MQFEVERLVSTALRDPSRVFEEPKDVATDRRLTTEQKLSILERWEMDARELAVAEEENMAGGESSRLHEVLAAKQLVSVRTRSKKRAPSKA